MKHLIMVILMASIFSLTTTAQDKIYLKGKKGFVKAKVLEVGLDDIKYKEYANEDGITRTVDKEDVEKIVFQNGKVETFFNPMSSNIQYDDMRKNIIKYSFFMPIISGASMFTFERALKLGQSFELHLVGIGLGKKIVAFNDYSYDTILFNQKNIPYYKKQTGVMIGASYKVLFRPDVVQRGIKYRHILQGSFFRPSFYLGFTGENYNYRKVYTTPSAYKILNDRRSVIMSALMLEFGKQWVFSNRLNLEIYGGVGYGADNRTSKIDDVNNFDDILGQNYTFLRPNTQNNNLSFSLNGGVKFGYLFKVKKWDDKDKKD